MEKKFLDDQWINIKFQVDIKDFFRKIGIFESLLV